MYGAILAAASVACASAAFKALAAVDPRVLREVDYLIIAAGIALAGMVCGAAFSRRRPVWGPTAPPRYPGISAELGFAPVLAYLAAMLAALPLLQRVMPKAGDTGFDYAALLTNHIALIAAACASAGVLHHGRTRDRLAATRPSARAFLATTAGGLFVALGVCELLLYATRALVLQFEPQHAFPTHTVLEAMQRPDRPVWLPAAMWVGVTVIAPLAEELFFRGVVLHGLAHAFRRRGPALALSALLFGLAHYQQPQDVPALAVFGVVLGIVGFRTRSVAGPVIVHALFNAKTMLWLALGATE